MPKANANLIFRFALAIFFVTFLASCERSPKHQISGYLYFTYGSYIGRFSFQSGETSILGSVNNGTAVRVGGYGNNRLLLTVRRQINRQKVWQIEEFDIRRGYSLRMFPGSMAHYLPMSRKIVHDDGNALLVTRFFSEHPERRTIYRHQWRSVGTAVSLTDDEALLAYDELAGRQIYHFNGLGNGLTPLEELTDICRLDGAVWVPDAGDRGLLACQLRGNSAASGEYHLVTLDGIVGRKLSLPDHSKFRAIAYLRDHKALMLVENRRGNFGGQDKTAIWIHDFNSDTNIRITKGNYFGPHIFYQGL